MNAPVKTSAHEGLSRLDVESIRRQLAAIRVELLSRVGDRMRLQLKQVDDALRKMERGVYGFCEACDRPIIKDRLFAAPSIRYCSFCAGGQERRKPEPTRRA